MESTDARTRRCWWWLVPRMSVRALMTLVLIVGGGLGWTIQRANTQRRIVAALERSGGSVEYLEVLWLNGTRLSTSGRTKLGMASLQTAIEPLFLGPNCGMRSCARP
jgi:hypothetical protein